MPDPFGHLRSQLGRQISYEFVDVSPLCRNRWNLELGCSAVNSLSHLQSLGWLEFLQPADDWPVQVDLDAMEQEPAVQLGGNHLPAHW